MVFLGPPSNPHISPGNGAAEPGLRRIYFSDRLYSEEELPPEFKLFLPVGVALALGCVEVEVERFAIGKWWLNDGFSMGFCGIYPLEMIVT